MLWKAKRVKSNLDNEVDVVVVGAGIAGLYMLYHLLELDLSAKVLEQGGGVGGTWYWNRYPGARCDVESWDYCYSFSEELNKEWNWSERYPTQPELERYLNYVTDRFDLRKHIEFNTRVEKASFDNDHGKWTISTSDEKIIQTCYFISAAGSISENFTPKFKGGKTFLGEQYHTSRWPQEEVDFSKKRVGVIGTGSSGVQVIPQVAKAAEHLFVFQRTAQYTVPARNYQLDDEIRDTRKEEFLQRRERKRKDPVGLTGFPTNPPSAAALDSEIRNQIMEEAWEIGGNRIVRSFNDTLTNRESNQHIAKFVREKIWQRIDDPAVAKVLARMDYPIGARRLVIDIDYFEAYNRKNVTLVDCKSSSIEEITTNGIRTSDKHYELDVLIYATGFDGVTGSLLAMNIEGIDGLSLRKKWEDWPTTYMGLVSSGFPNLFFITGPGSPSVFSNVIALIEQQVEWIAGCLSYMKKNSFNRIDTNSQLEEQWRKHVQDIAEGFLINEVDSWWTGSNIPGKSKGIVMYLGGLDVYRELCETSASNGYAGFVFSN